MSRKNRWRDLHMAMHASKNGLTIQETTDIMNKDRLLCTACGRLDPNKGGDPYGRRDIEISMQACSKTYERVIPRHSGRWKLRDSAVEELAEYEKWNQTRFSLILVKK